MKSCIVSIFTLLAAVLATATAADLSSGAPGTPTPTPYPQVTVPGSAGGGVDSGGAPLLAPVRVPAPPRMQPLPQLQREAERGREVPRTPGG